jgi:hypothetical protein
VLDAYVVEDFGILTAGSLAVSIGDIVEYSGDVWIKVVSNLEGYPPPETKAITAIDNTVVEWSGTSLEPEEAVLVLGVAPLAEIIPIKVRSEKGSELRSILIDGIAWAINQNVDIIVVPFGFDFGILVIAAASKRSTAQFPAKYDSCLAIGASNQNQSRASFSLNSNFVDYVCPGANIITTDWEGVSRTVFNNTGAAAAYMGGACALYLSWLRRRHLQINFVADGAVQTWKNLWLDADALVPITNSIASLPHIGNANTNKWI